MCFGFFKKRNNAEPTPWQTETQLPDMQQYVQQNSDPVKETASFNEYAFNGTTSFTLSEFGGDIKDGFEETENPSEEELERAIKNVAFYDGDFFTLTSSEPVNGFTMIGGSLMYGDLLLTASAHIEYKNKDGKRVGKAYDRPETSYKEMFLMLKDFMKGRTPDLDSGNWKFDEDIDYPD